jgi:hypothetical protein
MPQTVFPRVTGRNAAGKAASPRNDRALELSAIGSSPGRDVPAR